MNMPLSPPLRISTVADLIRHLGDIPTERIRMNPLPGTATERDVIAMERDEHRLCELVDGVLVEKTMGMYEGRFALVLGGILDLFVFEQDLGIVCGADTTLKIMPGLVRIPDVSFVSWARLPERKLPARPIPDLVPNLAVEVLSEGNTPKEMQRKLNEYFAAGVTQVWFANGTARWFRVYTSVKKSRLFGEDDTLSGGKLLPGFSLSLRAFFDRVGERAPAE